MKTDDGGVAVEHIVVEKNAIETELARIAGISEKNLGDALTKGAVWWSVRKNKAGEFKKPQRLRNLQAVTVGDKLLLNYNAEVLATEVEDPVLLSDQVNYSFWFKPYGVYSQGSRWGDHCCMPFLVSAKHKKPAYLVHRLDRAASGLMILAHTKNALKKLTQIFADRKIEKIYQAEIHGTINRELPLDINSAIDGQPAQTRVLACSETTGKRSLVTVQITTGRKHQIRRHLASLNHPVVGDRLYDSERDHEFDLRLCAVRLALQCPFTSTRVAVDLPQKFMISGDFGTDST